MSGHGQLRLSTVPFILRLNFDCLPPAIGRFDGLGFANLLTFALA